MPQNLRGRVAMPNVDQAAKKWELELSERVGTAIQARRKALGLTAEQLAERTKELDYHVTRVAISKIERNLRAGKLDVAELFVLAVALEIPPALLLFPNFPDGSVELVPNGPAHVENALNWLSGNAPTPRTISKRIKVQIGAVNDGTELVAAAAERAKLGASVLRGRPGDEATDRLLRQLLERYESDVELIDTKIGGCKSRLWGESE
jgi:transcriptional regulator with XRE-family HTH domain